MPSTGLATNHCNMATPYLTASAEQHMGEDIEDHFKMHLETEALKQQGTQRRSC